MDKTTLEAKLVSIQERFNDVQKQDTDLQIEMHRLEGEFRLTQELIKELGKETPSAPEIKPTEPTHSNKRTGK